MKLVHEVKKKVDSRAEARRTGSFETERTLVLGKTTSRFHSTATITNSKIPIYRGQRYIGPSSLAPIRGTVAAGLTRFLVKRMKVKKID